MDKSDKKDQPQSSPKKEKKSSALDDILGGDLLGGDLGLGGDLSLDLDGILGTSKKSDSSPTSNLLDDLFAPKADATPKADSTPAAPEPPADAQAETAPVEASPEAESPSEPEASPEAAPEAASEAAPLEEVTPSEDASVSTEPFATEPAVAEAAQEEEPAEPAEAEPALVAEETPIAATEAPAVAQVEAEPQAASEGSEAAQAEDTPSTEAAPETPQADQQEVTELTVESIPEASADTDTSSADAPQETSAAAPQAQVGGFSIAPAAPQSQTIELGEEDELEEASPMPPPSKLSAPPQPPQPPAQPPPPPGPAADNARQEATYTVELSLSDAVEEKPSAGLINLGDLGGDTQTRTVELGEEDELEEVLEEEDKAPLLTPEQQSVLDEAVNQGDPPKATLPAPPDDLTPHEVSIPEAKLPPPPADLKEKLEVSLNISSDVELEGSLLPEEPIAASQPPPAPLFDVEGTGPDVVKALPKADESNPFADVVSQSHSELEAIQGFVAPVADEPAPAEESQLDVDPDLQKELQHLGTEGGQTQEPAGASIAPPVSELAVTVQDDEAPAVDKAALLEAPEAPKEETAQAEAPAQAAEASAPEFPPTAPAPAGSGTADFMDAAPPAPQASTPASPAQPEKKKGKALMQTVMYGPGDVDLEEALKKQGEAKEESSGKNANFQTQMYGAEQVAEVVSKLQDQQEAAQEGDEAQRPTFKVQIDESTKDQVYQGPVDSLFDDPNTGIAVTQVKEAAEARQRAKELEAQAEQAIQSQQIVQAIRIYHQLQQQFPHEKAYDERLKQLVALQKKATSQQATPASPFNSSQAPQAARPTSSAAPAPAATPMAPVKPARPAQKPKAAKAPSAGGLSTTNIVLGVMVLLLSLVLLTGLVWPGWLRRSQEAPKEEPKKLAPMLKGDKKPASRR